MYRTNHHQGPVCWRRVVMWSLHLNFHWGKKINSQLLDLFFIPFYLYQ